MSDPPPPCVLHPGCRGCDEAVPPVLGLVGDTLVCLHRANKRNVISRYSNLLVLISAPRPPHSHCETHVYDKDRGRALTSQFSVISQMLQRGSCRTPCCCVYMLCVLHQHRICANSWSAERAERAERWREMSANCSGKQSRERERARRFVVALRLCCAVMIYSRFLSVGSLRFSFIFRLPSSCQNGLTQVHKRHQK